MRTSTAAAAGLCLVGILSTGAIGLAAQAVSPPVVEYSIRATLDPSAKTVEGRELLTWRNPSSDAVSELRFHLYLNAFKNNRSTFLREAGSSTFAQRSGDGSRNWGAIDLISLKTAAGSDLKAGVRFVQPDGNDPSDETVLAVPLPSPVAPHGQIVLDIAFRDKLPRIVARTGFVRDFFLVAQWFPKIGVYEPAGMRRRPSGGWNCHAFHAYSEFYADYGSYDVTLTVPSRFVVGATGNAVSRSKSGAFTTYRFAQKDVHDFAWTADPRSVVVESRFDPRRDVPSAWTAMASSQLGLPPEQLALKPVMIRLLLAPNHEQARERYLRSAKQALSFYGLWFGAYPYETLTIVDPPDDGLAAGGMEYPTFITGDAPWLLLHWPMEKVLAVEDVTIHEFGHQYWYGMVGSNEFEEPWLDEGINSDSEYRAMDLAYGAGHGIDFPGGIHAGLPAIAHWEYLSLPNLDPIRRFAWRFFSGNSYGTNSYSKVALFLAQLRHDIGVQTYARAERAYFQEWSFRHPSTEDFFDVFERVCRCDLSTYRRNIVEGTSRLDWRVVSASSRARAKDDGLFDRPGGRVTVKDGKAQSPGKKDGEGSSRKELSSDESVVVFGNVGEWAHAAGARLVFEDGRTLDWNLPADARWVRLQVRYRAKLAWAAVDPDRENAWEWRVLNDSKVVGSGVGAADTAGRRAALKYLGWTAHFAAILQQLMWALA